MRTDSNSSGRRSSRGRGSRNYRNDRRSSAPYPAKTKSAPAKKSLWEKIISFFTGEKGAPAKKPQTVTAAKNGSSEIRGIRKPEAVDVTSPKLYVGNLSFDATESDLSDLFNGVGHVQLAEVVSHKVTQKSKGFAFVTMQTTEEAKRAVEVLHDKDFMGRKLVVSGAKTSDIRSNAA